MSEHPAYKYPDWYTEDDRARSRLAGRCGALEYSLQRAEALLREAEAMLRASKPRSPARQAEISSWLRSCEMALRLSAENEKDET